MIREQERQKITNVDNDRGKILFWTVFWPIDLAYKLVFQWFDRLGDILRFVGKGIRGIGQAIKNKTIGAAPSDLLRPLISSKSVTHRVLKRILKTLSHILLYTAQPFQLLSSQK